MNKTEAAFYDFHLSLESKKIKKGTVLLRQGEKVKYIYQVKKGCLKGYVTDKAAKEHILQFAPENWIITDMNSSLNDVESAISIDAIEDSEVIFFDKKLMHNLETIKHETLLREMKRLHNHVIANNKRLIQLLSSTAEERYLAFIETYPSLVQRLPVKLIASYLNISPEFLSRIRKKIVQK
nr:Crp/Fnr family transcriptional regulator [uncultured Flavobacterium sp.]